MEYNELQFRENWDKLEVSMDELRGAMQDVWVGFYTEGRALSLAELEEIMVEFDAWVVLNSFTSVPDASVVPVFVAWFFKLCNDYHRISRKV
jgi:hypothetical protein